MEFARQDQVSLLSVINQFYESNGPIKIHGEISKILSKNSHMGRYLLAFETQQDKIPKYFKNLTLKVIQNCQKIQIEQEENQFRALKFPENFLCGRLNCVLYPLSGQLHTA